MHVKKNICDILFGILLDFKAKTKDTLNARRKLMRMKIRKKLHPIPR